MLWQGIILSPYSVRKNKTKQLLTFLYPILNFNISIDEYPKKTFPYQSNIIARLT